MGNLREGWRNPETVGVNPQIIIGTSNRNILAYLKTLGITIGTPSFTATEEDIARLGVYRSPVADILRSQVEVPEFINVSTPRDCIDSVIARAGFKAFKTLACDLPDSKNRLVFARDTVQVVYKDGVVTLQERPGETIEAQRAAAEQLARSDFAGVFTAEYIVQQSGGKSSRDILERLHGTLMFPNTIVAGGFLRNSFNVAAANFRIANHEILDKLPDECFSNLPGGLNYEHPEIMTILSWGDQSPFITDIWEIPQTRPFFYLSPGQQERVQMIRRGAVPGIAERMDKNLNWFTELPQLRIAVEECLASGGLRS